MPGPRQPHCLRTAAGAHVEHPQPLADPEPGGYLLVELSGDQLPPDDIRQTSG
ncbi:hypothetical protein ACIBCB_05120 [Streptomyces uncialis]|uniref:hypothetical protein n=1 Tax=Streptomyces uncialis TaxID=1048205 RepID=UPI00379194F0